MGVVNCITGEQSFGSVMVTIKKNWLITNGRLTEGRSVNRGKVG